VAEGDFAKALDRYVGWGVSVLELGDAVCGKSIADLTMAEARRAAALIAERGLSVYCLSTGFFQQDVERGEDEFRRNHLRPLKHVLELAQVLKPRLVGLTAATTAKRADFKDSISYVQLSYRWLIPLYREAADLIDRAGFGTTIENGTGDSLFSAPREIVDFFRVLGHRERICFGWDVQDLWQCGTFPGPEVYKALKGLIGYCHVKGGQHGPTSKSLRWRSALEDASWPVAQVLRQVVHDGVSPVICLRASLGAPRPGYEYGGVAERDIAFLRKLLAEC